MARRWSARHCRDLSSALLCVVCLLWCCPSLLPLSCIPTLSHLSVHRLPLCHAVWRGSRLASTEQSWHRRARRARQAARGVLAVAQARQVLARHHGGGQGPEMQQRYAKFLDDVPRGINLAKGLRPWSCNCGQLDNWLCRSQCMRCGRDQPHHIAAAARRMAERVRREREEQRQGKRGERSPSRGRSRERVRGRHQEDRGGPAQAAGGREKV